MVAVPLLSAPYVAAFTSDDGTFFSYSPGRQRGVRAGHGNISAGRDQPTPEYRVGGFFLVTAGGGVAT